MKIVELNSAIKVPFKIDGRVMFSDNRTELIHLTLQPGEKLDYHKNPFDVIFYILEGKGTYSTKNKDIEIVQDSSFEVKKEIERKWENNSQSVLRLLVVIIF